MVHSGCDHTTVLGYWTVGKSNPTFPGETWWVRGEPGSKLPDDVKIKWSLSRHLEMCPGIIPMENFGLSLVPFWHGRNLVNLTWEHFGINRQMWRLLRPWPMCWEFAPSPAQNCPSYHILSYYWSKGSVNTPPPTLWVTVAYWAMCIVQNEYNNQQLYERWNCSLA